MESVLKSFKVRVRRVSFSGTGAGPTSVASGASVKVMVTVISGVPSMVVFGMRYLAAVRGVN